MANLNVNPPAASRRGPVAFHGIPANSPLPVKRAPQSAMARSAARSASVTVVDLPRRGSVYRTVGKRVLDILLVLALLPVYLPIVGIAALLLFVEGGNPFYRQARLGLNGERFSILKLRTMVRDADKKLQAVLATDPELKREWDVSQKLKNDPRITKVGAMLRRTSMDELPQLWNVLKGEMSLVGPRPMMPDQLSLYGDPRHYFAVRPGITGYWQIDRRNESSFADRAHYDAAYDAEMSLPRDAKVLWKTIGVVLRRTGH